MYVKIYSRRTADETNVQKYSETKRRVETIGSYIVARDSNPGIVLLLIGKIMTTYLSPSKMSSDPGLLLLIRMQIICYKLNGLWRLVKRDSFYVICVTIQEHISPRQC